MAAAIAAEIALAAFASACNTTTAAAGWTVGISSAANAAAIAAAIAAEVAPAAFASVSDTASAVATMDGGRR